MEVKDLLPVGSVVRLKDATKRLMICGIKQTPENEPDKLYDYMGVLYPEGHLGDEYNIMFNDEDIEAIYFKGFDDIERQEFIGRLEEYFKNQEKEEKSDD